MKILIVSWSVLPNAGGSSIIVEQLAQNFDRDSLVVLGSRRPFQKPYLARDQHGVRFLYFFSEMYLFGRGYRFFEWYRKLTFKPLLARIREIIRNEGIDHVIGVYPNPFYCLAAARAATAEGVPFSSYFHNTYVENVAITDPKAQDIQDEIFGASQCIFVMSKGMLQYYKGKYGDLNFIPLVHTFNSFPDQVTRKPLKVEEDKPIRLVAIGNFNESNIEATARLIEAIKSSDRYTLSVYTHVPQVLLRMRGIDTEAIEYMGFIDPQDVHQALQAYDICVLTHGFTGGYGDIEYATIFPTRTIPLLLSGKPIFAHSPQGSFLNDFLRENACAELVDVPDQEAILAGLDRLVSDEEYQTKLIDAAAEAAKQFYGPRVVDRLMTHIKSER